MFRQPSKALLGQRERCANNGEHRDSLSLCFVSRPDGLDKSVSTPAYLSDPGTNLSGPGHLQTSRFVLDINAISLEDSLFRSHSSRSSSSVFVSVLAHHSILPWIAVMDSFHPVEFYGVGENRDIFIARRESRPDSASSGSSISLASQQSPSHEAKISRHVAIFVFGLRS